MEDEIEAIQHDLAASQDKARKSASILQANEKELKNEDGKLTGIRRELTSINGKITNLEGQKDPEPTDILAFVSLLASFMY